MDKEENGWKGCLALGAYNGWASGCYLKSTVGSDRSPITRLDNTTNIPLPYFSH